MQEYLDAHGDGLCELGAFIRGKTGEIVAGAPTKTNPSNRKKKSFLILLLLLLPFTTSTDKIQAPRKTRTHSAPFILIPPRKRKMELDGPPPQDHRNVSPFA